MGSRDDGRKNLQTSTGGRHDFFFYVNMADMHKFAFQRFQYGMRLVGRPLQVSASFWRRLRIEDTH